MLNFRIYRRIVYALLVCSLVFIFSQSSSPAHAADCTGVTGIPAGECAVLLDIYNNMNGVNWTPGIGRQEWFTPAATDACTWYGVGCTAGNITIITIPFQGFGATGTFPTDYTGLTQLQRLRMINAPFVNGDITAMVFPASLRELSLANTGIGGNIAAINFPPALEKLELYQTGIIGNIDAVTFPDTLWYIDFDETQVGGDLSQTTLPNALRDMRFSRTNITGDIAAVTWPPALEGVALWETNVYGDISAVTFPNSVTNLGFRDTNISGDVGNFVFPANIQQLEFLGTLITGDIGNLTLPNTLSSLLLAHTNVSGDIANLTLPNAINSVYLSGTQVTGDVNVIMSWSTTISTILLDQTGIYGTFDYMCGFLGYTFPFTRVELGCTQVVAANPDAEFCLESLSYNTPWNTCDSSQYAPRTSPTTQPLNNNPDDLRSHGHGIDDNVYATVHMQNGAWQYNAGGVPQELIDYGVILAIDVWEQGGDQYFDTYERVCLLGEGRLIFFDATQSPRPMVEIPVEFEDGYTCGWIPNAGTVVLIAPEG